MNDDQPQVAVKISGPHMLTVVAMPIAAELPTVDEAEAMEQAIKAAEQQALLDAHESEP